MLYFHSGVWEPYLSILYCCLSITLTTEWPACVCMGMCACVCVSVFFCRFKCLKSTSSSTSPAYWKHWGLKMLGGHFGVLILLLMADRNSTYSNPGINLSLCKYVVDQVCESDLRERGSPSACALLLQQEIWKWIISQTICNEKECRGTSPKWVGQIGTSNTILLDATSLCPSSVKDCLLCCFSPTKAQQE